MKFNNRQKFKSPRNDDLLVLRSYTTGLLPDFLKCGLLVGAVARPPNIDFTADSKESNLNAGGLPKGSAIIELTVDYEKTPRARLD